MLLLPSPLWGGVGGGGRGIWHFSAPWHDPSPQPSPTRGEGAARPRRSRSLVTVSLDPITLGIDNKRRVVVRTVVGAQPRFAVVATAVCDRCPMKGIDALARRGGETKVQPRMRIGRNRACADVDPERRMVLAVAEQGFRRSEAGAADWR